MKNYKKKCNGLSISTISVYKLSQYATAKEFKTVMKYVADFANRRQREIAGLEPTETK